MYPYEYMDSFEKFFDGCEFFSSLKGDCSSESGYSHAINVWNAFKMNTMGEYYDFYLKTDVFLLTDIFEKFIDTCLEYYGLDPYFSSPGLSWDVMLKMTELELMSDIEMHMFIKKGIRRGISCIAKKFRKQIIITWNIMILMNHVIV